MTTKTKRVGELGTKKCRKTLAGNEVGKEFLKEKVGGDILSGEEDFLLEDGSPIDKETIYYVYMTFRLYICFCISSNLPPRQEAQLWRRCLIILQT